MTADLLAELDDMPLLLPYQQEWFADESDVKICEKSRRIGISWTSACEHVFVAGAGLMDGWYIGYSEQMGEEFIRDVSEWAKVTHQVASAYEAFLFQDFDPEAQTSSEIQAFRVKFASGCYVTALSSRPRNLRSKQGFVTIDEAAYHDDLAGLIKAAMALIMWGGRVEIISTHDGVDNPFNVLIEQVRAGKFDYSLHRYTLDDALEQGLYRRIALVAGKRWTAQGETQWRASLIKHYGDGADEELFCVPSRGGTVFLARELVFSRMVAKRPVLRLTLAPEFTKQGEHERKAHVEEWLDLELRPLLAKLPKGRRHYMGQDFGRTSDLTVFAPGTIQDDLTIDVPFVVELSSVPHEQQKQVAFALLEGLPNFSGACLDAGGNGSYLAEVCALRFGEDVCVQVKITEQWHAQAWAILRARLEEGRLRIPSDERLLSDFAAVKRVNGLPKLPHANVVKIDGEKAGQKRHGDAAVACAMLVMAAREVTVEEGADLAAATATMRRMMGLG